MHKDVKYSAMDIAFYIVSYCKNKGKNLFNLNLQKILYYCQGNYISIYNKPLFKDDLLALKYGPIVYDVYTFFSSFGSNVLNLNNIIYNTKELDEDTKIIVSKVIDEKIDIPAWKIAKQTTKEDPFVKATNNNILGAKIKEEDMKKFFKDIKLSCF